MFIGKTLAAAAAAVALAFPSYAAPAGAFNDAAPKTAQGAVTLIQHHRGGGGRGGGMGAMHGRGGMGMPHMGMPHMGAMGRSGPRMGAMGMSRRHMGSMRMTGPRFGSYQFRGNRYARLDRSGVWTGRFKGHGHRFRGRTAFYHGRRGYWRGGWWVPFAGFGLYDDGNCYWNCRAQGYGPAYCRAFAYDFCY
jgi:hypothetical protein